MRRGKLTLKIYVAGPMTGYQAYNAENFLRVRRELEAEYYDATVVTPFDTNSRVWRRHFGRDFDPAVDVCEYGDPLLREMMAADLRELLDSDLVVVLDGWQRSRGTTAEVIVAYNAGIPLEDERGRAVELKPGGSVGTAKGAVCGGGRRGERLNTGEIDNRHHPEDESVAIG